MKKSYNMKDHQKNTRSVELANHPLTVLRIAIGWHFLFEGLLKVTNPEWSAAYFLNNATGPFASLFQSIALNPGLLGITDFLNELGSCSHWTRPDDRALQPVGMPGRHIAFSFVLFCQSSVHRPWRWLGFGGKLPDCQ